MSKLRHAIDLAEQESRLYKRVSRKTVALLVSEIEHYMNETIDALDLIECYFEDVADADCDENGFIPSEEMRLLERTRKALEFAKI